VAGLPLVPVKRRLRCRRCEHSFRVGTRSARNAEGAK
jgi:hypothetical protein